MDAMTICEQFTVELDGAPVRGELHMPETTEGAPPPGTVMFCAGLPTVGPETGELYAQLTGTLVKAGLAVATMTGGSMTTPQARLAVELVDDAAAVFHGLSVRDELDLDRIGILGHSLGGITASCLAERTDRIHRICLLAPITTHEVSARLNGETDDQLAAWLGGDSVPTGFFDGLNALRPTENLAAHDRPTLIMHGAADRIASPELSMAYRDAVATAGHQVEHVLVGLGDHVFAHSAARGACLEMVTRFFAESAGNRR